ncbi:MAG: glycosyltransferase family 1 protein [Bacteroidetes bacterium]|nr:MAG: glycosyltransferase family 1 protein [Bacteroidota bacterium]
MNSAPDIVYYTLFPWDMPYSSVSLSLTAELAKTSRVFYVNHPYTFKDVVTRMGEPLTKKRTVAMLTGKTIYEEIPGHPSVTGVQPPAVLPINWLSGGPTFNSLYEWNRKRVLGSIRELLSKHRLRNFIYLNCYNPYYAGILPKGYGQLINIYQCIDDMEEETYTARHGARLEREVIKDADLVLTTSRGLLKKCQAINPESHPLFNAANTAVFEEAQNRTFERPKELKGLEGKLIGFTGNMDPHRIDYQLLLEVARRHPDKHLVLVGPLNSDEPQKIGLDKLPNVHFTGGKHISELPAYLQHFDVVLIPFRLNKLTASIYPLKINEYLAAGKPVVSTRFSEDIQDFEKVIYLASDRDSFLAAIDRAIAEDNESLIAQRQEEARKNTWEERARQFWKLVEGKIAVKN